MELSLYHVPMRFSLPWPVRRVLFLFFSTNMANEMTDSMEKIKLTSKEEEIIAISNEERLEAI